MNRDRDEMRRMVRRNNAGAESAIAPPPRYASAPMPGGPGTKASVLAGITKNTITNTGVAGGIKLPGGTLSKAAAPIKPAPAGGGGGGGGGGPKPEDEAPETEGGAAAPEETTWCERLWQEHRALVILGALLAAAAGYWAWKRYA